MPLTTSDMPCNRLFASGELNSDVEQTTIELASGMKVSIPTAALLERAIPASLAEEKVSSENAQSFLIPVISEEMVITKRQVPLETVRIVKSAEVTTERRGVSLASEHWDVVRVPMNKEVEERSDVRHEGDVTIYPVFEERAVTRKVLFLLEELHVRRVTNLTQELVEVDLMRENVTVERIKS